MLYFTSELELRSNINMSQYNSELFLAVETSFQYSSSSVNLRFILDGVRPKNHHAELIASRFHTRPSSC